MNNLNLSKYTNKLNGDTLSAIEWNGVFNDIANKFDDVASFVNTQNILFTVTPKIGPINFPKDYYSADDIIYKVRTYASTNNIDADAILPGSDNWPISVPGETYTFTINNTVYTITYYSNNSIAPSTLNDIIDLVGYAKTLGWIASQPSTTPVTIATDANNYTAYVGEDTITKINASSSPSVALTYTSDNNEVVIVDSVGNLEGIGTGTAHITITPTNSASYSGSKTVNVTVMPRRNNSLDLTIATEGNVPWSIPVNSNSAFVVEVTPVNLSSENAPCQLQWTAEPSGIVTYSALDAEEHRISVTPQNVGTVTLTAIFSGNDNDAPADISHTLTVTAAA